MSKHQPANKASAYSTKYQIKYTIIYEIGFGLHNYGFVRKFSAIALIFYIDLYMVYRMKLLTISNSVPE